MSIPILLPTWPCSPSRYEVSHSIALEADPASEGPCLQPAELKEKMLHAMLSIVACSVHMSCRLGLHLRIVQYKVHFESFQVLVLVFLVFAIEMLAWFHQLGEQGGWLLNGKLPGYPLTWLMQQHVHPHIIAILANLQRVQVTSMPLGQSCNPYFCATALRIKLVVVIVITCHVLGLEQ